MIYFVNQDGFEFSITNLHQLNRYIMQNRTIYFYGAQNKRITAFEDGMFYLPYEDIAKNYKSTKTYSSEQTKIHYSKEFPNGKNILL